MLKIRRFTTYKSQQTNKMVFNPPTQLNYTNADLYAYERRKIQQYNFYLRFRPEIMSHTYIEISYNSNLSDNNDIPWDRKIRFNVHSRKKFCSQASCQSHFPRGNTCGINDEPRVFKSGNTDIESCQYGCYNLYEKTKLPKNDKDKDKKHDTNKSNDNNDSNTGQDEYARAPFLLYSYRQCACTIHNNSLFALGIDDYTRTDHHPLPRVDTIGTGFEYVDSDNHFNHDNFSPDANLPYIDKNGDESFRFNMNRYYCDDFQLNFNGQKCYESVGEQIFGFLISSTLYKACQYGIRFAATGVTNTDVQKLNLPPIRENVLHETFDSWKNDVDDTAFFIDPNVSLKDLGFTEDMKHCIFTTEYGYPGKIVEPLASGKNVTGNLIDYEERNKNRLNQFKYDVKTGWRIIDEYEILGIYKYIRSNPTNQDNNENSYDQPVNRLTDFFRDIVQNLGQISAMILYGELFNYGLKYSSKLLNLSAKYLEGTITPTLLHIVERQMRLEILNPALHVMSRLVASLIRTSASFIKLLDVVTIIAGIVDLFDLGFDFFNMNKIMDNGTIQQYSQLDIASIREAYGYGTVEYSPVNFMLMCEYLKLHTKWRNTPNSVKTLRCIKDYKRYKYMIPLNNVIRFDQDNENAYEWVSEYIFSLKVNSNGLKINWDDEKKLPNDVTNQYLKIDENIYLKGMDEYSKYTETFRQRVKYGQYLIYAIVFIFLILIIVYSQLAPFYIFVSALTASYIVFSYALKS